jgi:hypothetical protein
MTADNERQQPSQSGDPDASETLDQPARGGEGTNPSQAVQSIEGRDQQAEQTQVAAPEDDVGVPEHLEDRTD